MSEENNENAENPLNEEELEETESKDSKLEPTSKTGKKSTCAICKHEGCASATEIYFSSDYSIDAVALFFKNTYGKEFNTNTLRRHFREHVEPFQSGLSVIKGMKLKEIQEKINSRDKGNVARVPMIKEMIFDFLTDVYAAKPMDLKLLEDKKSLRELSETFVKLSKAFKDLHEMEMNIIGYGKTPEEQAEQIQGVITGYLRQVISRFDDIPEAQKRLEDLISKNIIGEDD